MRNRFRVISRFLLNHCVNKAWVDAAFSPARYDPVESTIARQRYIGRYSFDLWSKRLTRVQIQDRKRNRLGSFTEEEKRDDGKRCKLRQAKSMTRAKRKRGNSRGRTSFVILHVSDGPKEPSGLRVKLLAAHGGTNFKELCNALEMETASKMGNWLRKLLFDGFCYPSM